MSESPFGDPDRRRVVITGCGMVTCLGRNVAETFHAAREGRSGVREISRFDATNLPGAIAGEVDDAFITPGPTVSGSLEKVGYRGVDLMRTAADQAAEQAGLPGVANRERLGCMIGSHGADPTIEQMLHATRLANDSGCPVLPDLVGEGGYDFLQFYRRKPDVTTALMAMRHHCLGTTQSIVSACAAGAQAIGEAYRAIRRGQADTVLCGGAETKISYVGMLGFILLKALCERYRTPQSASRPFDRRRNGFVMSEGAAALVVEELEHARERGATILGEIRGYADSADAYRITDVHPQAAGAVLAMQGAIADAKVEPADIRYVNAHGTSTQQNDKVESLGIQRVFGDHVARLPVSSNKSMLGHAIAAAGAIEAILTLMGMRASTLLPTINYERPDPKCHLLDYVPNEAREYEHDLAISNSFGFGGQNACLCLALFRD